jgi:hypothetical protein
MSYFGSYIALRKITMNTQHLFSGAATVPSTLAASETKRIGAKISTWRHRRIENKEEETADVR